MQGLGLGWADSIRLTELLRSQHGAFPLSSWRKYAKHCRNPKPWLGPAGLKSLCFHVLEPTGLQVSHIGGLMTLITKLGSGKSCQDPFQASFSSLSLPDSSFMTDDTTVPMGGLDTRASLDDEDDDAASAGGGGELLWRTWRPSRRERVWGPSKTSPNAAPALCWMRRREEEGVPGNLEEELGQNLRAPQRMPW